MNDPTSTPAATAPDSAPEKPAVCRRIRTKMYYVLGREAIDLTQSGPTAQYWCSRTATVIGPDDVACFPEVCQPNRGCFEPEE
jgi:hypothetical protein